jgi:4-hydroxyphenylpyruvate dioxygenase
MTARAIFREADKEESIVVKKASPEDKIQAQRFHHVEFYCGDAVSTYKRFVIGLGAELISKCDQSTGNKAFASYVLQSHELRMVFTAPYGDVEADQDGVSVPGFNASTARAFFMRHGLAVRAVCIEVENVEKAYQVMLQNGGQSILEPRTIQDPQKRGYVDMAEVQLYGDVVLRLLNKEHFSGSYLPYYHDVDRAQNPSNVWSPAIDLKAKEKGPIGYYGIRRFDHIVGNLWSLQPTMQLLQNMTVGVAS